MPADIDEMRALEAAKLDRAEKKLQAIIDEPHYVVASGTGQVVTGPDGRPLMDASPAIAAISMLERISTRRGRLWGLDARQQAELSITVVEAAIRQKEAEIEAARRNALPATAAEERRAAIEPPAPAPPAASRAPAPRQLTSRLEDDDDGDEGDGFGDEGEPVYERGSIPPQPVTGTGRREGADVSEDWGEAYAEHPPGGKEAEQAAGDGFTEAVPGWRMTERRASWS